MEIKRDITDQLKAWKENSRRKPLVLQGARQVGKSWALKKFGEENYVLQALVRQFGNHHYYWTSGNTAEVEFVLQQANRIIPIEVKADKNVTAKSLAFYRKQYAPQLSIRLSTLNMRKDDDLLNLPLYLVDKLKRFVEV